MRHPSLVGETRIYHPEPPMTATPPDQEEVNAVSTLAADAISAVQSAPPDVALNALLTAYLNLASAAGVLDQVPGAGVALGQAARRMLALQSQLNTAPPGAPIH